jgi:hypothetical protein
MTLDRPKDNVAYNVTNEILCNTKRKGIWGKAIASDGTGKDLENAIIEH